MIPVPFVCAALTSLVVLQAAPQKPDVKVAAAFREACSKQAEEAASADRMTIRGTDGWLFLTREVRHMGVGPFWGKDAVAVSRSSRAKHADPLPAIVDFNAQLAKAGIELWLVPVPPKSSIYADKLCPDLIADGGIRVDPHHQSFFELLTSKGVNVVDLAPAFLAAREDDEKQGPVYCKTDTHWSPRGCRLAAVQLAGEIGKRDWSKSLQKQKLDGRETVLEITGDLARIVAEASGASAVREKLPAKSVVAKGEAGGKPVGTDSASPVLLLGDSHCLVFQIGGEDMHAQGTGLAAQLALELGAPVDMIGVRGSGSTSARRNLLFKARRDKTYLPGKKLVIWCFAARDFTESTEGWRKFTIIKGAE